MYYGYEEEDDEGLGYDSDDAEEGSLARVAPAGGAQGPQAALEDTRECDAGKAAADAKPRYELDRDEEALDFVYAVNRSLREPVPRQEVIAEGKSLREVRRAGAMGPRAAPDGGTDLDELEGRQAEGGAGREGFASGDELDVEEAAAQQLRTRGVTGGGAADVQPSDMELAAGDSLADLSAATGLPLSEVKPLTYLRHFNTYGADKIPSELLPDAAKKLPKLSDIERAAQAVPREPTKKSREPGDRAWLKHYKLADEMDQSIDLRRLSKKRIRLLRKDGLLTYVPGLKPEPLDLAAPDVVEKVEYMLKHLRMRVNRVNKKLLIYALKEAEQRLSRASLHRKGIQAPPPRYGPEGSSAPRVARGTDPRLEWVGTQPPTMHQLMKAMAFLQQAQYDRVDREKPLRRLLLRWPEILTYDVTTQCIPVTSALLDAGVDFADVLRMVQIFPPILLLPPATVTERLRHLERLGLTLSQRSTLAGVMPHVVLGKKPEELRNRLGVIQYTHKIGPQEAAQYMYETLMQELPNSSRLDRLENRVVWWEEYVQTEEEILYQPSSAGNEVHLYDVPQSPSRGLHGKQVFRNRPSTGRQRERQAKVASRTRGTGKRPSSKHWIRPSKGNGS